MSRRHDPSRSPSDDTAVRQSARRTREVPSWWADLRRVTLYALAVVVGCTLLLLLASTGLMPAKGSIDEFVAADGLWAGILAGVGSLWSPYMQISLSRPDTGFRHQGLPGLVVLGVLIATIIYLALMSVWPLIVGDRAAPDEVIATLLTNPLSLALVASYIFAMHAWGVTCMLGSSAAE